MAYLGRWMRGRGSRSEFWVNGVAAWLAFYLLSAGVELSGWGRAGFLIDLPALAVLGMLCVRRLHDLGRSGWYLLALLLPVLGGAWLFWQLACRRGLAYANRWGADPDAQGDFLTVTSNRG